jgi:hypothetical protein
VQPALLFETIVHQSGYPIEIRVSLESRMGHVKALTAMGCSCYLIMPIFEDMLAVSLASLFCSLPWLALDLNRQLAFHEHFVRPVEHGESG